MGYFIKKADVAEAALHAVKNSAKVYNFHAKQLDDTMHIADSLNDKLQALDPDMKVSINDPRRMRLFNRERKASMPSSRPILVPKPRRPVAERAPESAPVPKLSRTEKRMANMNRWRSMKERHDYIDEHGRYAYDQAVRMGKFGETVSCVSDGSTGTQLPQLGQMQQNAMFAQGAEMGEQLRNQELEKIKKRRIQENEATAPGTNQHRGMDPMKSMMRKMSEESPEERLRRLEAWDKVSRRRAGKVFGKEVGSFWRDSPNRYAQLFAAEPWSASGKTEAERRAEMYRLREELGKTAEEDPYDRLKRLEAMVHSHDSRRYYGKYLPFERPMNGVGASENNNVLRNRLEIRKLRSQLGMKGHGLVGTGRIMNDTGEEIERARAAAQARLSKHALQTDSLGKNTSPATQGATVDAPMPQTNYAKNTLDNEYANRLAKKQLSEMNKLQNQQGQQQSTSTTTTTANGTTTTTTTGLANSGLMAALSLGA